MPRVGIKRIPDDENHWILQQRTQKEQRKLDVPTLIAWDNGDIFFDVKCIADGQHLGDDDFVRRDAYGRGRQSDPPRQDLLESDADCTDLVRSYKVEGDLLTLTTAPARSEIDGKEGRSILVWKKVGPTSTTAR